MKIKFPTHNRIEYEAQQQINQLATERLTQIDQTTWMKFKFLLQQIFVAISLVVFAIPMLAIYLLVRLTSAGPAIFKQVRVGLNGKIFTMYKFRTMSVKAELNSGPVWSPGKNDPRLTTVGRFLRFVHLDELPQLFNVLKGDMSLIGPRPERPVFVIMLSEQVEGYLDRLQVRPGITGLAQVYLDADVSIECVRKKIVFDNLYIHCQSTLLNLQIALCTLVRMFGIRNGRGPRWFGLNQQCVRAGIVQSHPVIQHVHERPLEHAPHFNTEHARIISTQATQSVHAIRPNYVQLDESGDSSFSQSLSSKRKPK